MDFKDEIIQLGERVEKMRPNLSTEEATKNALIMPFINSLGYDVFNPMEVVPEFVADIGIKKGEKVDYAIMKNYQPIILIECKTIDTVLDPHSTQLFRYFHTTKAKFAILTNGKEYKLYTDLVDTNKMDEKPFLIFDITKIKDSTLEELKKFHKSYFNIEEIVSTASELKYTNELKALMNAELRNPSEPFVKYFVAQIYSGRATEKVIHQFTTIVKKSLNQWINEIISEKFQSALDKEKSEAEDTEESSEVVVPEDNRNDIQTTEEEMEGFYIIKAILREKVDVDRIHYRDTKSYFGVLLDDNNRKPLCRLRFNAQSVKYLGVFDQNKNETKESIDTVDDIYKFRNALLGTLESYLNSEDS
ncbi:type I restriction endonuclease [Tunicatimonas pelagia]|uniref:type I restriction endonuclease n=1 Tax=Tunicatimonas pelagia TaxID=931531 RepID=UPI00266505BA|nr:type I restriction endonuclease [Tunicatimonas pelagia]WKN43874.1 type I restriction enzyme HsdR N-terminal domain-containing protein [Tunicatimonas pelagia]